MIWRVRGHATFRDLARSPACRQGAIGVRLLAGNPDQPPSVAYAVPRAVGCAVERNRLRRRLRAAVRGLESELLPGGAYLLSAGPAMTGTTPTELHDALRACLRAASEKLR